MYLIHICNHTTIIHNEKFQTELQKKKTYVKVSRISVHLIQHLLYI